MEHQRDWDDETREEFIVRAVGRSGYTPEAAAYQLGSRHQNDPDNDHEPDSDEQEYWESADEYDPPREDMTEDDWHYWLEVVGK